MRKRSPIPTAQELEVMEILWERGQATVREIYDELRRHKPVAYTRVMRMVGILEGREHVDKQPGEHGSMVYRPVHARKELVDSMLSDFVTRVFKGSGSDLVTQLLESGEISREALIELSRLPD